MVDGKVNIMQMNSVDSSNVASIGYDAETQMLHVRFKNGGEYAYENVPPQAFERLSAAGSIGQHLNQHIKGKFTFRKM